VSLARASIPLPDPPLADGDLLLRPWAPHDAAALAAAWADPEIARWTGVPAVADEAAALRWISGEGDRRARGICLDLVVELGGELVGEVGLAQLDPVAGTAELGWWVASSHRRRRVATRAARTIAAWAVDELAVHAVIARCHRANSASGAVARAAGFEPTGVVGDVEVWRFG
jgi:RimJ/RimL family protein N-acetyltransferase